VYFPLIQTWVGCHLPQQYGGKPEKTSALNVELGGKGEGSCIHGNAG
jgi:hypothetical protein